MADKPIDKAYLKQSFKDFYDIVLTVKAAVFGGSDKSLVSTGEKYEWNEKIGKSSTAGLVKNDGTIDTTEYATSGALAAKADKVVGATNGNFAGLDTNGNITDSGKNSTDFIQTSPTVGLVKNDGSIDTATAASVANKVDKVPAATSGNFATFDASGGIADSGIDASAIPSGASASNKLLTESDLTEGDGIDITGTTIALDVSYLTASRVGFIDASEKGVAGGVAALDSTGKIPGSQLPGYIDEVVEGYLYDGVFYEDAAHTIPITPQDDQIYVDLPTNTTYRWGGTVYAQTNGALALGETHLTAYYGDLGKAAYDHSQINDGSNPHGTTADNIDLATSITIDGNVVTDVEGALGALNTLADDTKTELETKAELDDLVPSFDPDRPDPYLAGEYVVYNNKIYKFTSSHTGPWTGTDVVPANLSEEIDDVKESVDNCVIPLLKAEYDALSYNEKHDQSKVYYVTDYDAHMNYVELDDNTTALDKVWSSSRIADEFDNHIYQLPQELTKEEYDELTPAEKHDLTKIYYVEDYDSYVNYAELNDNAVAFDKTWSSQKISDYAATIDDVQTQSNKTWSSNKIVAYIANLLSSKVDKITGKGLSTNDYTDTDKTIVGNVATQLSKKVDKITGKGLSTNDYTTADKNIVSNVTTNLASKVDKVNGKGLSTNDYTTTDKNIVGSVTSNLANKVDKVSGKGLSTNDYTTDEKNKLAGIAYNANNYSLPDATTSTKGGVIVGAGLKVNNGVIQPNQTVSKYYTYSVSSSTNIPPGPKSITVDITSDNDLYKRLNRGGIITSFLPDSPSCIGTICNFERTSNGMSIHAQVFNTASTSVTVSQCTFFVQMCE